MYQAVENENMNLRMRKIMTRRM